MRLSSGGGTLPPVTDSLAQLGRLLVERGVLSQTAFETAVGTAESSEARFLTRLLAEGVAPELDLVSALAEHFGMPGVDLSQSCFLLDVLDLVPRPVAEGDQILPLSTEGGRLHVAVAAPHEAESTADEVRFITGMEVSLYVAISEPLRTAIAASYDLRERGAQIWRGPALPPEAEPGLCIVEPAPPLVEDVEPVLEEEIPLVDAAAPAEGEEPVLGVGLPEAEAFAPLTERVIDLAPEPRGRRPGPAQMPAPPPPIDFALSLDPGAPEAPRAVPTPAPKARSAPPTAAARPLLSPVIDIEVGEDEGEEEVLETVRLGPKRVLVVDDEPDIVRLCQRALQSKGYAVDTAADGAEAEKKLLGEPPDLVLLDAMLPQVHGFEICQRIKASPRLRGAQVVMMSAVYRGWRFAQDARETYGADDYLEKPFHLADLLRRVEERLAQGKAAAPARKESERLYKEGMQLLESGKPAEARALLERAIKDDAFSPRLQFALARVLASQGDHYRAITAYERSVELRPTLFPALKNLAQLYLEKGFRRKAAETLERALQAAPDPQTREQLRTSLLRLL